MKFAMIAVAMALKLASAEAQLQDLDVDRELTDAKVLYQEGRFTQAVVKLQRTIVHLEYLRDAQRHAQLADAHLHLALSLIALNDSIGAKENLKAMLRLDPDRRLDPEVHAPRVIDLVETARSELAAEPATLSPRPRPTAAPAVKKSGSKAVPIVLGVGAAAGAATAIVLAGGSEINVSASPSPAASGNETLPATLQLFPNGSISARVRFRTSQAGRIDLIATFGRPVSTTFEFVVNLIHVDTGRGQGGFQSSPGATMMTTHWDTTVSGDFDLTLGPLRAPPYSAPESGLTIPITFQVKHP